MDKEDKATREARCKRLWQKLGAEEQGTLNINGLKKGLDQLDHPLKNADSLLKEVLKAVDSDGNGHIEYHEFETFIAHTENELWQLFRSIDRDHNGQLDKTELRAAFGAAGIHLSPSKLDQFFEEVDTNHDGVITWDEWRKFLLFMPAHAPTLRSVLSYYSSSVTINPEGDVHVSNENVREGLGKLHFLRILFGAVPRIFQVSQPSKQTSPPISSPPPAPRTSEPANESRETTFPWDPGESVIDDAEERTRLVHFESSPKKAGLLTDLLPFSGYFVAGGIAGVVSRTATAPLDRLKVYLISQVGSNKNAVQAAKSGAPVKAATHAASSLLDASKTLWRMGGIRSLFAGNGLNVLKVMPESAIKFGSYEGSKRAFARLEGHDDTKQLNPWSQFLAAGMGGIISQFAIYPLDTLKFRMQNETKKGGLQGNALIFSTAKKMWSQGPRSFYRGLPLGLIGMFPYSSIDLTTYEYLKIFITKRNAQRLNVSVEDDEAQPGNFTTASIGAFSGAFGATAVYPLNLLRTRLQSQGTAIHPQTYTGMWDVTRKTFQGEGLKGFFRGVTPNLLKVVPAVSITYVVYDNSKAILGLR